MDYHSNDGGSWAGASHTLVAGGDPMDYHSNDGGIWAGASHRLVAGGAPNGLPQQ